jgi:hypothetical protein
VRAGSDLAAALKSIYQVATAEAAAATLDAFEQGRLGQARLKGAAYYRKRAVNQFAILFGERFTNALH